MSKLLCEFCIVHKFVNLGGIFNVKLKKINMKIKLYKTDVVVKPQVILRLHISMSEVQNYSFV